MIRQIDTTIGLIVGGIAGLLHPGFLTWASLFGIIILWGYLDYCDSKQRRKNV